MSIDHVAELARFRRALAERGPNDMLFCFRHYPPGVVIEYPHTPHPDVRYLHVPMLPLDELDDAALAEVMARANREFGDPLKDIGGPRLPHHRRMDERE